MDRILCVCGAPPIIAMASSSFSVGTDQKESLSETVNSVSCKSSLTLL